jgi:hypothetical protein
MIPVRIGEQNELKTSKVRRHKGTHQQDFAKLISPHGGCCELQSYQMEEIVYDGTVAFCDRLIFRRSRTHD